MKHITVFCGSSSGGFKDAAYAVGVHLAQKNIGLVYGGADVGLMGAVADGALSVGGRVIGVLPQFLQEKEIAHQQLTELVLVSTMHERKMKMQELSDGFIALPGGYGTLEELFEVLTWAQLGLHQKPIGILNLHGFYDHLIQLLAHMTDQGFLKSVNQDMLLVSDDIEVLLGKMEAYRAPLVGKWLDLKNS